LFKEITQLEEYYLTRTEKNILQMIAPDLVNPSALQDIIELGSGDSSKISILLDAFDDKSFNSVQYYPVDFSQSALVESANTLSTRFPGLTINGYVLDFSTQLDQVKRENTAIFCFFGSTLGNFDPEDALELLRGISKEMQPGDALLLGLDMVKAKHVLHAAYNDSRGITAAFNKNILHVVNKILDSDFDQEQFNHIAFFNKKNSRIEMHLEANTDTVVRSPWFQEDLNLQAGEKVHTENSYKFSFDEIRKIGRITGLTVRDIYSDPRKWFTLTHFEKA
jgi:L-histidine N-alpha-methyltransferase